MVDGLIGGHSTYLELRFELVCRSFLLSHVVRVELQLLVHAVVYGSAVGEVRMRMLMRMLMLMLMLRLMLVLMLMLMLMLVPILMLMLR